MNKQNHSRETSFGSSILALFICFVFSGASGLIFELAWSKALSLSLGNTLYSISTVVGAYMAGLGIGAFIAGRFSGGLRYPIRTYGWIEGTVGLFGLASPFLFKLLSPIFGKLFFIQETSFSAFLSIRFLVIFAILLIPTIAMGMTLPILVSALTSKRPEFGSNVAKLYGLNTAGAVFGTLCGGFLLLPHIGLFKTIIGASVLNLTILTLIYIIPALRNWTGERVLTGPEKTASREPEARDADRMKFRKLGSVILVLFALSGFLAMVYEVGWTRVLSLIIGSSVYSFTIILATFLLGIALGSLIISGYAERTKRPFLVFAILEVFLGLSALAGTFLFHYIPEIFASIINGSNFDIKIIVAGEFLLSGLISFIPCFIMGLLFPIAACAYKRSESSPGKNIGNIYFFNTFGAIFGSVATGFFLIPFIGILTTLIITSALSVIIGIIVFFLSEMETKWKVISAALAISFTFFLSVLVPPWNINRMNRGLIQIIRDIKSGDRSGGINKEGQILFYKEGVNTTVAVSYVGSDMYLKIGGKIDASAVADAPTQILCAQIPMLYADDPRDVCVIGLGSGITTNSILTHPVRSVETLEIEEAVIKAAKYFYSVNHDPLSDPRSNLILEDARTYLTYTDKKYDVIISEPSNPWIAGINSLFTQDFYEIVLSKLKDGGVFSQWLQTYELSASTMSVVIRTMNSKFPGCHFHYVSRGGDSLLIAKKGEVRLDSAKIDQFFSNEKVRNDLARIKVMDRFDLASFYIAPLADVAKALGPGPVNTDDNSLIEYRAPFEILSTKKQEYSIAVTEKFMDDTLSLYFPDVREQDALLGIGIAFLKMNDQVRSDFVLSRLKKRRYEEEVSEFIDASRKKEDEHKIEMEAYDTFNRAEEAFRSGDRDRAAQLAVEAYTLNPDLDDLAFNCSLMLLELGSDAEAEPILKELIARKPFAYTYTSYINLGSMYWNQKESEKALEYYRTAIAYNPYFAGAYLQIAQAYAMLGAREKAKENAERALSLEPENTLALGLLNSL